MSTPPTVRSHAEARGSEGTDASTPALTLLPLATILDEWLSRIWRHRSAQERLFDLGERKERKVGDRLAAAESLVAFLVQELRLPHALVVPDMRLKDHYTDVRNRAERLVASTKRDVAIPGVGRGSVTLGPLVGADPKTLSNSLGAGLDGGRPSHRWLATLARIGTGDAPLGAWLYHRRSLSSVAAELAGRARAAHVDTGDAVLLFSLSALWQRRRPTTDARSNRGLQLPRRTTPKPIAGLTGTLLQRGQFSRLLDLARRLPRTEGRALAGLVMESALTESHLAAHPARRVARAEGVADLKRTDPWLRDVDGVLASDWAETLLGREDRLLFQFRVHRMHAFLQCTPVSSPPDEIAGHPYVALSLALEAKRRGQPFSLPSIDPLGEGAFMLLPQTKGSVGA